MGNPSLQVLYDDVLVFDLGTAIRDNDAKFALKRWNQFRLMSRYFFSTYGHCCPNKCGERLR